MLFKYLFLTLLVIAFVPPVRRFVFYLLVGRKLVKEQEKQSMQSRRKRGKDINVDYAPPKGDSTLKGGEDVDYEDIK